MEEINNQEEYELIRERIKTRPINRKKLIRRTVITAAMAVIFGVLACITFLVLEPVFSNMLTPEEEPVANEVKIPIEEEEILPEDIAFVTTQELENMWPDATPKERENNICRLKKAVFLMQIGDILASGERHDGRAPDYDDWALNGDILVYYPVLDSSFELSSMGIRVDENSLASQLKKAGCEERAELPFQKAILNKELPYTVGGGIGQSRMCMYFLRKAHIGEVHSSVWPDEMKKQALEAGIQIL